jgi:hypothetical protein
MAEGILTLNPISPEIDADELGRPSYIEAPVGAGIAVALEKILNKKEDEEENLPAKIEEEKTPQQEPPEGEPDLLPELSKQTVEEVIRKEIKEKQEPINKIQTWDKYFDSLEEAEQVAKENNITLRDLEIPAIKKQINFKKTGDGYEIYFDKKYIGELADITQFKQEDGSQRGNERTFNMYVVGEDGYNQRDAITTIDGIKYAKEDAKDIIAKDLLRDTEEPLYPSLKDIFQNLEYDKKGLPKKVSEESERIRKELDKNKKAFGGLIDKPLPGRSRDI